MSKLYEQIMELALTMEREAEEMVPTEGDPEFEYDLEDPKQVEAWVLGIQAQRIKDILNASDEADIDGSASSQYYIESGVRLPKGYEL